MSRQADLRIELISVDQLTEYDGNARAHSREDIEAIEWSIQQFGFNDPIGIWSKDNVIVEGHGRLKAAKNLGMTEVPCIRLDHMTDEQRRAYGLAHNKTAELSKWDFEKLDLELAGIHELDMSKLNFKSLEEISAKAWFENRKEFDNENDEKQSEEYNEFLDKFEAKKTTDDCYTPELIYEAVADWVIEEYGVDRKEFVRPFYPGGDYTKFKYAKNAVVVDNPPFSIFAEIIRWYTERGIKFFLFAPSLTVMNYTPVCAAVATQVTVTYENGAKVSTSFCTNLEKENVCARTAPDLFANIKKADEIIRREKVKELPKYSYPDNIVTAAMMGKWSKYGIEQSFMRESCILIDALDEQKEAGKAIYGKGLLLSERAAAERAAAERAAAQKWTLSNRERDLLSELV